MDNLSEALKSVKAAVFEYEKKGNFSEAAVCYNNAVNW